MSTLDDVISTVLRAREDGPDALAAVALSFGSAMELGTLGNTALKARLAETRAALEATEATAATLRTERDAASAAAKAARQRMEEVREQCDRARDDAEMCARQRDEARARASMLAQDLARAVEERDEAREALAAKDSAPDLDYPARAEVWKLRESVDALRSRAERAEAWAHAAVQERESFSLRLSAAERARDEARAALDLARESAREAREEIAGALALVDEARARVEAIAVERNAIVSELSQATDAMMQARAECDALRDRPTYEARTVAPTPEELAAHDAAGGGWLVSWDGERYRRATVFWSGFDPSEWANAGLVWIAFDADGLPCAWPVVT